MASSIDETISVSDLRKRYREVIEACAERGQRFSISRNSKIEAVLVGAAEWKMLNETLEILADRNLLEQIEESSKDIESGRVEPVDDVLDELAMDGDENEDIPPE